MAATGLVALGEAAGFIDLPVALSIGLGQRLPFLLTLHMAAGGVAIIATPLAILLSGDPGRHRPVARLAALAVAIAALSALPVALLGDAALPARAAFLTQGAVWLGLLLFGVGAIRQGDRSGHKRAMALVAAVTSGAVNLRLLLFAGSRLLPYADFDIVYSVAAWASWTVPLMTTAAVLMRTEANRRGAPAGARRGRTAPLGCG